MQSVDSGPRLWRDVLDATRLLVLRVDGSGQVVEANQAFERATGLSHDAWHRPIWELAELPAERARLERAFHPFREQRFPSSILFHLLNHEGPARVVDWELRVLAEDGSPSVVFTGIDLSERLAAEQALVQTEALQRLVLDRVPAIVWTTDVELHFTASAGGGLRVLDLEPGQLNGTSLYSILATDDPTHPAIARHLRALKGEASSFQMGWRGRLYQTRLEPLQDRNRRVVGSIGVAFDVTEQAATARTLEARESQLQRVMEASVIGIFFADPDGLITEANDAFLQLVGFSREELREGNLSWRRLTPPEYQASDDRADEEVRTTGHCTPYEKEYETKDGGRVPVLVCPGTFDGAGGPGRATSFIFVLDLREQLRLRQTRDVLLVEEQRARLETERANARLHLLVDSSRQLSRTMNATATLETLATTVVPHLADWCYVVQPGWQGEATVAAVAHADPARKSLVEQLSAAVPDLGAPEGVAKVFRTGQVVLYEDVTSEQLTPAPPGWPIVSTRDPKALHVIRELGVRSFLCVPIEGRSGTLAAISLVSATDPHHYGPDDIVLARDLAARAAVSLDNGRLLFEALDSVRARDEFLAVAAHELRTPLTSLLLQVQMLRRLEEQGRDDVEASRRGLALAENQVRRLSSLVDGLLDVTRLASNRLWIHVEEMDLRKLIDKLLAALSDDLSRAGCRVSLHAPAKIRCRLDRARIEQVLVSLLSNAMKFGAGRPIEITVEVTADELRISVRDHGIGIAEADQTRIFGRFERAVSTRQFGGLGLGLYISVQIVRAHQGTLRVESKPGQGSCFIVELPRGLPR